MSFATFGFTLQKIICDMYNITPNSEKAVKQFDAVYDNLLKNDLEILVRNVFVDLNLKPIECTTLSLDDSGKELPYNFILSDNSTLSIRTNFNSQKVSPRKVGQAGYDKLNLYFKSIYGKEIKNQSDIKNLMIKKIDKVLPIFFDNLFDADYIVWIYYQDDKFNYALIPGTSDADLDYQKKNFSFTQSLSTWKESTTLKYKNKSIAEIQVHSKRTFKFRFIMKNIIPLIVSKTTTTETLGITAEKTICDIYNLDYPENFVDRYSATMQKDLEEIIKESFNNLPEPVQHTGSLSGGRGGSSKSPYDFILQGNKTLSVKTNIGKMVCPPEVGQPNDKTCYLYFSHLIEEDHIDKFIFKKMVFDHVSEMIKIYLDHLFDSDYLLRIYKNNEYSAKSSGKIYNFQIVGKNEGRTFNWEKDNFDFTKKDIDSWNESNTVHYKGITLGEFQVHNKRNCYKFRFNFDNLMEILSENE